MHIAEIILLFVTITYTIADNENPLSDEFIDIINQKASGWKVILHYGVLFTFIIIEN